MKKNIKNRFPLNLLTLFTTEAILKNNLDHNRITKNTFSLLEAATDDDTEREKKECGDNTASAEIVFYVSTTVSAARSMGKIFFTYTTS